MSARWVRLAGGFLLAAALGPGRAHGAASIGSARFEQDASGLVRISYRLDNPENRQFDVSLSLSRDGGRIFALLPRALAGDIGTVAGSGPKLITWDVDKDYPGLSCRDCVFAVEGTPAEERAGIEWVFIPGGSFLMGSEAGEADDEKPVHRVTVKGLYMAKTEVTNKQYRACVSAGACSPAHVADGTCYVYSGSAWKQGDLPASFQGDGQPVVCVDWSQAKAFSAWVGARLPTEAEWEYAARSAGKDWAYPWGDEQASCSRAVMDDGGVGCGRDSTWPVCSKPAGNTEQGLCDMAGNVWEVTQDWYHGSYDGAPVDGSAWESPRGSGRVFRGGSWSLPAGNARTAFRYYRDAGRSYDLLGLRPARSR
ncbi:MAG: formylglycine-generating enzyme family protein [Elusimicrobia bacterium]|nr:formylglycine-generating enzyme family protein [Elusimicrobiota bacterium]